MFSWFNHKKYPVFFKSYLEKFKQPQPNGIANTRFVVFDTETTGLDTKTDRILSIGAIGVINNIIDVSDSLEIYLSQETFNAESVKIHGLLKGGTLEKISELEAIEKFINYIGNSVLVAHHAGFDIEMINVSLKKLGLKRLKNKTIDTGVLYKKLNGKKDAKFSLDALSEAFRIPQNDRHTASGDAYITAQLFLKILSKLKKERTVHFSDLFRNSEKNGLI